MRNKRLLRTLSAFCLTMVVAFGFTIPAFAQGSEQAPAAPAEGDALDTLTSKGQQLENFKIT